MIRDIHPKSPVASLRRDFEASDLERRFDFDLAAALVGMSRAFITRALGRPGTQPKTLTLAEVLILLDLDGYQETFIPRSGVPEYLLSLGERESAAELSLQEDVELRVGDARDLLPSLRTQSVQCVVTSTPYWGMRLYANDRDVIWADGERCPYGFEQTPEGFIRHTIELLFLLKPSLKREGSVWWNVMDTYNSRSPIRLNARERLHAMEGKPDYLRGWTEHAACRHSAGHMFLADAELSSIPGRIAERASRIGFRLTSIVTWSKSWSVPEPVKSRPSRQTEYILQLSRDRPPFFDKTAWQRLPPHLGGPNLRYESSEKLTDVWSLPTSGGKNGHGAEFPLSLPGRCIALTTKPGDVVLDPFVGSGSTALAALELGRRFIGFDISDEYVAMAKERISDARARLATPELWSHPNGKSRADAAGTSEPSGVSLHGDLKLPIETEDAASNGNGHRRGRPKRRRPTGETREGADAETSAVEHAHGRRTVSR